MPIGMLPLPMNKVLIIRFSLVTAPIPSSLPFDDGPDTSPDYQEYRFYSRSNAKDGTPTPLKPTNDIPEPQPYVRVGEAAAGTGTATITPATVYQAETGHDFRIFYTAPGPMYGSQIRITIPSSLIPAEDEDDTRTHDQQFEAHITVSENGGVDFDNNDRLTVNLNDAPDNGGYIIVHIDDMHKGDQVRVFYEGIDVGDPLAAGQQIDVETAVNAEEDSTPTFAPLPLADNITGGAVEQRDGSGTITINYPAVEIHSTKDYTFTYKAATDLTDAYLVVALPDPPPFVMPDDGDTTDQNDTDPDPLTSLQEEERTSSSVFGYVVKADDQTVIGDGAAIKWKFTLKAG